MSEKQVNQAIAAILRYSMASDECRNRFRWAGLSHVAVVRPIAALRHSPCDILAWVFDVASLAMHTVLEIDDKPRVCALFFNKLIHARRAVAVSYTHLTLPTTSRV